jgi:predicted short-subunit dehydrogenase-like oxidoreductase (DUF2520 family)
MGTSLALALRRRGARLTGFVCATDAGRSQAADLLHIPAAGDLDDLISAGPNHYFITVPDAAVPVVAAELGNRLAEFTADASVPSTNTPHDAAIVLHTSGATSVSALDTCAQAGALTVVFHPLQTFSEPVGGSKRFDGAAVAVTPGAGPTTAAARNAGFKMARALGARPFVLPDHQRALYHAAASVASNYLVTLEHCAELLFVQAGMPSEDALSLFLPLVRATLDNMSAHGSVAALTGPLSRGDEPTIAAHLAALERECPALLSLYRRLGLHTLALVRARGDVSPETLDRLTRLLDVTP